jgi:GMP synthase (glutamine-hydrolysing)
MNILILDYSVDRTETAAVRRWLPQRAAVTSCFVDADFRLPVGSELGRFTHIVHSGSALSILEDAPFEETIAALIRDACVRGIAQMGICYGHQLLCKTLAGRDAVRASPKGLEAGWCEVEFSDSGRARFGVTRRERVWQHHFDEVTRVPPGAEVMATNSHTDIQAFIDQDRRLLGVQFHPEFDREEGNQIFSSLSDELRTQGYSPEHMVQGGPSLETGRIFFDFFLRTFNLDPAVEFTTKATKCTKR